MTHATSAAAAPATGPLLARLLDAQERDAALSSQVPLRRAARALAAYARQNGSPWLEPVSPGGHRLAGAAAVLDGAIRIRPSGQSANGQDVLLVEAVAVGPAAVAERALRLRAAGAARVCAFAVELQDTGTAADALDGLRVLHA